MNSSSVSEKSETIFPPGLSLGPRELDIVFPFNFIIDSEARVVRAGPALRRLLPDFAGGEQLDRTFRIKRPAIPADFHEICDHGDQLFMLEVRPLDKLTLRGQMLHLPQANAIIFLGTPWLTASADIGTLGLFLQDFAIYDSAPDYLYLMRAQTTSLADAEALAEQLSALNRQLERRVEERTQEVVAKNEELRLYATVFDSVDNAVVVTDAANNIIAANLAFTAITGYSAEEVIGRNPRIFSSGMHPPEFYHEMWETLTTTGSWQGEMWNRRKSGEIYVESVSITLIRDEKNNLTHHVAVFSDISEHKAAEENLLKSEASLRAILDNSPYLVWLKDTAGRFIKVNQPFFKTTGLKQIKDLLGKTDLDLWPKELAGKYRADDAEVMATRQQKMIEEPSIMEDGKMQWVETFKTPILDEKGQLLGTTGFAHDITERKQYMDGLRKARELAEEIATAKSSFLANMSHEIRTPMNAIIGLSQLALNKQTTPEVRSYLEKILNSSNNLLNILNDILDLSKTEAGRMTIEHSNFDLNVVLENLDGLFAVRAKDKYLDFSIEVLPDVPRDLVGDALRLQQVLSNLLGNAIKFTEHGKITLKIGVVGLNPLPQAGEEAIALSPSGGKLDRGLAHDSQANGQSASNEQATLLFSVEDTGIGIAKEDIAKLFQPFSQVDNSISRRFGGTGLGLSISHNLLKLMDSDFSVESTPGKGTTFRFELALGITAQTMPHEAARHKRQREAGTLSSELRDRGQPLVGARILVAEDDIINQQVVREFLKLSGIEVALANNGKEVLELLDENMFDAVLMDVHMPVMNGIEAAQQIRARPRFAHLPIIALTADIASEDRENYLASGMNDFVAKPIDPEQLIATLVRWVKHPGIQEPFGIR